MDELVIAVSFCPPPIISSGRSATISIRSGCMDNLMAWYEGSATSCTRIYWIGPRTEEDAEKQVVEAVERGVEGFVGCSLLLSGRTQSEGRLYPHRRDKPPRFSSIRASCGTAPSSKYNRPAEFEELIESWAQVCAGAHPPGRGPMNTHRPCSANTRTPGETNGLDYRADVASPHAGHAAHLPRGTLPRLQDGLQHRKEHHLRHRQRHAHLPTSP